MKRFIQALLVADILLVALLGVSGCNSSSSGDSLAPVPANKSLVANPKVEGPVTGGLGIIAVASTLFPLSWLGYDSAEYFLSGTANSYVSDAALTSDGYWTARPASSASYKTRIVVYKPTSAAKFNGTVIVEWLNVSGGADSAPAWINAHTELQRQGYAWVGVSAQKEGIDGGGVWSVVSLPLKTFDPTRYGTLLHPGNSYSYDIFSQAAQAIRHPQGIDPLAGLTIKAMIASGESQSAERMTTYVNAIAPLTRLFDGFMLHSRIFGGAPLSEAPQIDVKAPTVVHMRTDVAPLMTLQTESDLFLLQNYASTQDDGSNFRLWEMAGTSHADLYLTMPGMFDIDGTNTQFAEVVSNSQPIPGVLNCAEPVNSGPQHFMVSAAYAALNRWVTTGVPPTSAPRLTVNDGGTAFVLDAYGNTLGGIRTPYVDAPTATLSAYGQPGSATLSTTADSFCFLFGTTTLFDSATLKSLYPTHADYVNAVNTSANNALAQGFLLAPDVALIEQAAQESTIGN